MNMNWPEIGTNMDKTDVYYKMSYPIIRDGINIGIISKEYLDKFINEIKDNPNSDFLFNQLVYYILDELNSINQQDTCCPV